MKTFTKIARVKADHSKECFTIGKIFMSPLGEGSPHQLSKGFLFYGFSLIQSRYLSEVVAEPTQGPNPVKSHTMAFKDLLPVCEPKLSYTETSFDAIGRVNKSNSLLGGRGLDLLFLTFFLPFTYFLQL